MEVEFKKRILSDVEYSWFNGRFGVITSSSNLTVLANSKRFPN